MTLSIAERRAVMHRAATDSGFYARLRAEPHGAIAEVTGRTLPAEFPIRVLREVNAWAFVLIDPAAIEPVLPEPTDLREAIENRTHEIIRDEPTGHAAMAADSHRFAAERLDLRLDLPIALQRETPDTLVLILPNELLHSELHDDMLDLVVGGGQVGANCPPPPQDGRAPTPPATPKG